jgi:TonB family protein
MISRLSALLCLLVGLAVPVAAAPKPPTGKWVADFGEAQCIAYRNYGTTEDPLYLALKAPPIGSVMQVMIMEKGRTLAPEQVDARFSFDDRPAIKTSLLAFGPGKGAYRTYLINMSLSDFYAARIARRLSIVARRVSKTFELTDVPELLKIMDQCVAEVREDFNITATTLEAWSAPQPSERVRQHASGSLSGVFKSDDYPWLAVARRLQGTTTFVLLINEQGRVADCSVVESSGAAALDAQSCAVAKDRARFEPAIGLDGKPAKEGFVQRITWRLE